MSKNEQNRTTYLWLLLTFTILNFRNTGRSTFDSSKF